MFIRIKFVAIIYICELNIIITGNDITWNLEIKAVIAVF